MPQLRAHQDNCLLNWNTWNVMAHAQKPDLVFQRNGRVHLNWRRGGSVQSITGSRGVRISGSNGSNAGYTMFWGRVQDYWLPTPLACFPFTSPTVRHRVLSGFNWPLPYLWQSAVASQACYLYSMFRNIQWHDGWWVIMALPLDWLPASYGKTWKFCKSQCQF